MLQDMYNPAELFCRLHPRNAHQRPHIVVFTGPHQLGAYAIATARHLVVQSVHVDIFMANFVKVF